MVNRMVVFDVSEKRTASIFTVCQTKNRSWTERQ